MDSIPGEADLSGAGGSGIENVSRSGRVRKKNSLLEGFESMEQVEKPKKKGEKVHKVANPKVILKGGRGKKGKNMHTKKGRKRKITSSPTNNTPKIESLVEEGDLEMDLPSEYDELSTIDADLDYDSSDIDDRTNGNGRYSNKTKKPPVKRQKLMKTQAQSTYMMEKSFETKSKKGNGSASAGGGPTKKVKAPRKDKGTPRVTAFSLYVKEQKDHVMRKFGLQDLSLVSKKLSEVWATLPPNQKRMWKNKADKIMKKNLNIKNSAPMPVARGGKKRGRPRIHTASVVAADSNRLNGNSSIINPPNKTVRRTANNFLTSSDKRSSGTSRTWKAPSPKTQITPKSKPSNGVALSRLSQVSPKEPLKKSSFLSSPSTSPSTSFSFSSLRQVSPRKDDEIPVYKVTGNAPIDVAAHFALLGESLSIIGERLMDVERQPVSGSLSVLMDSLLCAVTPLICLTQQVPELNCIPQERLTRLLDHVAFIMPGL